MRRREVLAALGLAAVSSGPVQVSQSRPSSPDVDPPAGDVPGGRPSGGDPPGGDPSDPGDPGGPEEGHEKIDPSLYDVELDVVADLGCSPDGDEPCTDALSSAVDDGVLFRFPPGEYVFDRHVVIRDTDYVAFVGPEEGTATFRPRSGFNSQLFNVADVGRVDLLNVDVDVTAPETTAGLRFITRNGFRVENVTFRGRGTYPAEEVTHAFYLAVENPDAEGVLRNAVARKGSAIGHYKSGNGRGAVWIGQRHHGTAYVENCEFAEFGNNALYTSRNPGTVRVHGGTFRNNNVCAVRLSGEGSYARNVDVEVDMASYDGPTSRLDAAFKTRGIVVEQGPFDNTPGVRVEDSRVAILDSPNPGPAVSVWSTGKSVTVVDSQLRADGNTAVVYRAAEAQQGRHAPATDARGVTLVGTEIEGTASQFPTVLLEDAPDSTLRRCHVRRGARERDGVGLVRSRGTLIDGGVIEAGRYPILLEGDLATTDGCLLRIAGAPELSTGLDGDAGAHWDASHQASCDRTWRFAPWQSCTICLTPSDLPSLEGPVEAVAITRMGEQRVEFHVSGASS